MYGMVNKAIEEMITVHHGEVVWGAVKRRAGVTQDAFISTHGYPDEITYALVRAAGECTGTPVPDILRRFGEHWILHTAGTGYGHMLNAAGTTLEEFLVYLPRIHDRVGLIYPDLVPPQFDVTDRRPGSLRLHYTTKRPGLTAFVEGLLLGLGKRFNTAVRVTLDRSRAEGGDTDVFLVEW